MTSAHKTARAARFLWEFANSPCIAQIALCPFESVVFLLENGLAFTAASGYTRPLPNKEVRMATRQIKVPEKDETESPPLQPSQHKRPEAGRYLLQVDRQTKGSYPTIEAAQAVGLAIKKAHPVVHVSVYDTLETQNTTVQLPTQSA
jgi:hypothetical protein